MKMMCWNLCAFRLAKPKVEKEKNIAHCAVSQLFDLSLQQSLHVIKQGIYEKDIAKYFLLSYFCVSGIMLCFLYAEEVQHQWQHCTSERFYFIF